MRRGSDPALDLLTELFRSSSAKFACPKCGHAGLIVQDVPDEEDDEAWGMARACEVCKAPIPKERLEALPDTRTCVRCQQQSDRGEGPRDEQYCPRCGAIMTIRLARGPGITRYTQVCPSCRS